MACNGNSAQTCGGPNRLTTFQTGGSGTTPTPPTTPNKSGKRGLAYNNNNSFKDATLANLLKGYSKITWGYDWGFPSWGLDSGIELYVVSFSLRVSLHYSSVVHLMKCQTNKIQCSYALGSPKLTRSKLGRGSQTCKEYPRFQ